MFEVSSLYDYFNSLGLYVVYVNVTCVLLVFYVSHKVNSALISLFTVCFFNLLMTYAQTKMMGMFETHLALIQHLWYLVFALCWLLSVYSLCKLHQLAHLELGKFAKTIAFVGLFAGALTITKYLVRMHISNDYQWFDAIYTGTINAVNLTVAILCIAVTATSLFIKYNYNFSKEVN